MKLPLGTPSQEGTFQGIRDSYPPIHLSYWEMPGVFETCEQRITASHITMFTVNTWKQYPWTSIFKIQKLTTNINRFYTVYGNIEVPLCPSFPHRKTIKGTRSPKSTQGDLQLQVPPKRLGLTTNPGWLGCSKMLSNLCIMMIPPVFLEMFFFSKTICLLFAWENLGE